ncbi:MAG: deoxyribonuclease IV [Erysipelotrichaceae bacterium]|nr:deoxyribonuclease IV [Erysipelotrichaceae bacterium]
MLYLGSHVGMKAPRFFLGSIEEALSYKANACMIYTGAPQNSKRRPVCELKVQEGRKLLEENGWTMDQVIVHAPYIINLANTVKEETAEFGVQFLREELMRVSEIGANILVLHPGAHMKAGSEAGVDSVIRRLNEVLKDDDSNIVIALETMAGKGSEIGRTFEELAAIRQGITKKERIGFCLDTCHIHDAGYNLEEFDSVLERFDEILGLENLKVLHINDSKNERGAAKDRHANLSDGCIGFDTLASIVHHPKLDNIVKILETPWIDDKAPYLEEIAALRNWNENQEISERPE